MALHQVPVQAHDEDNQHLIAKAASVLRLHPLLRLYCHRTQQLA